MLTTLRARHEFTGDKQCSIGTGRTGRHGKLIIRKSSTQSHSHPVSDLVGFGRISTAQGINKQTIPIPSMYGILWYIYLHEWLIFMVNVGKYTINIPYMDALGFI